MRHCRTNASHQLFSSHCWAPVTSLPYVLIYRSLFILVRPHLRGGGASKLPKIIDHCDCVLVRNSSVYGQQTRPKNEAAMSRGPSLGRASSGVSIRLLRTKEPMTNPGAGNLMSDYKTRSQAECCVGGGAIIPTTPLCFCRHRASAAYKTCEGDKQRVAASAGQDGAARVQLGKRWGAAVSRLVKN